jgi:hypothetical protein
MIIVNDTVKQTIVSYLKACLAIITINHKTKQTKTN